MGLLPTQPTSINLLEHEDLETSISDRLITWAVTYGRYIMIGTEIIVLLAFISRFSLDRRLTDLREEISQKQLIIEANQGFENEFRYTQDRLLAVRQLVSQQHKPSELMSTVETLLPPDLTISTFQISLSSVTLTASVGTTESFSTFLSNMLLTSSFSDVQITNISRSPLTGISFGLSATYHPANVAPETTSNPL